MRCDIGNSFDHRDTKFAEILKRLKKNSVLFVSLWSNSIMSITNHLTC